MTTLDSVASTLILAFISYQGVILLIDPEIRNRLYTTVAEVSNVAVPLVESVAEHGRLFVALILLPTIFYPKSWTIPRFISLIAYVIYICIIYNVYLFHEITQLGQFIFHIFVLTKTIFVIVDDLTEIELKERRLRRQQSLQARTKKEGQAAIPKASAPEVKQRLFESNKTENKPVKEPKGKGKKNK